MSLHPIGSGWSFDDAAIGDDWTVDLQVVNARIETIVGAALVAASPAGLTADGPGLSDEWRQLQADRAGKRKLFHVEAGIKLWQLINLLDSVGLALPTLGGANGQALAGVINTSVHGGDWKQPAFPGIVRAMHLVTEGGREVWVERASAPISVDGRIRPRFACPDVEIMRSDEVFNAALVGLGRFGTVYSYVLEVRPQFRVAEVATKPDRAAVFAALRSGAATQNRPFDALLALLARDPTPPTLPEAVSGAQPSFFQLVMSTRNPPGIWVQRRWETTNTADLNPPTTINTSGDCVALGLNALYAFSAGGANMPVDAIVNGVIDDQMQVAFNQGRRERHAWITAGPTTGQIANYRGVSAEVIFDANEPAYVTFLENVMNGGGRFRQVGWLSLRPSLATAATLSMHNVAGSHAVSIETALLGGLPDNEAFLTFVQDQARALGGRMHWGQACNRLDAAQVALQYGAQLDSYRRALWRLSGGSRTFSNAYTRQRGLEPVRDFGGLAVSTPAADQILVLRSGPVQSRGWSPQSGWTAWQSRAMGLTSAGDRGPVAIVSDGAQSHILTIASDGAVVFARRTNADGWPSIWWFVTTGNLERPWLGVPGGQIDAVSTQLGSIHVLYATARGNTIAVRGQASTSRWEQRDWIRNGRTSPGGRISGVSRRVGQLDVFMVGLDRQVYTAAWNAQQGWAGWWAIPGITAPPGAPVTAVSRREDFIDLFVGDDAGRVMSAAWAPGAGWKGWWHIQGGLTPPGGTITAVSRSRDQLDVFHAGLDGHVYAAAWNPSNGWGGWWNLGGALVQSPGAPVPVVSRSLDKLDLFFLNSDGVVQTMAWAPGQNWGGPWPLS